MLCSFGNPGMALVLLGACGGSGTATETTTFAALSDASSRQTAVLTAVSLDGGARTTTGLTGMLNRAANTASIGTLAGSINPERSEVDLNGGGTLAILSGTNEYSSRYIATPTMGNRTIGVLGVEAVVADLPAGEARFNGTTNVTVQDGTSLYDLTGTATIIADFRTGDVTTTLSGLDGTFGNGLSFPMNVTDVATITISGSAISGGTFSGGTTKIASTELSALGTAASNSVNGAFFGQSGEEVGGVVVIDDTATGDLLVFGDFIAK